MYLTIYIYVIDLLQDILKKQTVCVVVEVTGDWRRLHNKELYALYSSLTKYHSDDPIKKTDGQDMWHAWGRGELHTGL
jgi:hypothetical protein